MMIDSLFTECRSILEQLNEKECTRMQMMQKLSFLQSFSNNFCENFADTQLSELGMPHQQRHWVRMQKMQENQEKSPTLFSLVAK
jgi:hypothetical protein